MLGDAGASGVIVYLVSQHPEPLLAALAQSGALSNPLLDLRQVSRPPTCGEGCERTVCVLDLAAPPPGMQPPAICAGADVWYLLLVGRYQSLSIPWVRFCRSRQVELLSDEGAEASDRSYRALADVLGRLAGTLDHQSLSQALIKRNPWLQGCEDLVGTILGHPWRIRDPVDLARTAGVLPWSLRIRCEALQLKRVEHFITLVRWLAFELLTGVERMSAGRARLIVGISDPSNFRRQLGRVRYFVRGAGSS